MAAEVPGSDVSVTSPLQQPQQEQLDKDPEVAKVAEKAEVKSSEQVIDSSSSKETREMNMPTTDVSTEGEGMKKEENIAHEGNPEAPDSKAEELAGVTHDANVDSNEHTGDATDAEVPTTEVTTGTQIEEQPRIETSRGTVEEKTEGDPKEPEQALNLEEQPPDVENKKEGGFNEQAEDEATKASDLVKLKGEEESKKDEEAEPFRQEVVGEGGKDSNQTVEPEPVEQEVVKVEELGSVAEPKNVEEEKQEQPSKVQEEPKEQTNETKDGSESKSEPSINASEDAEPVERAIPPIEEKPKDHFAGASKDEEKSLEEVEADQAKDSDVAPAQEGESKEEQNTKSSDAVVRMEKATETDEKTEENGEVIRRASLGDMLKEENETKQDEELRKETATTKTEETVADKSFVPSTEEVKSRDVEVTPPAAGEEKKEAEKSSAPVETDKNGLKEEETKEPEIKAEEKSREEVVTKPSPKQSNNILSKVKHSFVKAKKAIIGKSPSSKTISTDISKGEVKVK